MIAIEILILSLFCKFAEALCSLANGCACSVIMTRQLEQEILSVAAYPTKKKHLLLVLLKRRFRCEEKKRTDRKKFVMML